MAGTELATKQQPNPASNDLLDEDMSPLRRAPPSRAGLSRTSLQGPVAITDGIVQFAGEREMWASFQDANLRKQKRLKALIAGAAVLVSACSVCTLLMAALFDSSIVCDGHTAMKWKSLGLQHCKAMTTFCRPCRYCKSLVHTAVAAGDSLGFQSLSAT